MSSPSLFSCWTGESNIASRSIYLMWEGRGCEDEMRYVCKVLDQCLVHTGSKHWFVNAGLVLLNYLMIVVLHHLNAKDRIIAWIYLNMNRKCSKWYIVIFSGFVTSKWLIWKRAINKLNLTKANFQLICQIILPSPKGHGCYSVFKTTTLRLATYHHITCVHGNFTKSYHSQRFKSANPLPYSVRNPEKQIKRS